MAERPDLSKLSSDEKDALIVALLERIEELERRVGLNSTNSGKPPSSEGFRKPSRVNNQREKTGRKSGGQAGHEDTTLRQVTTPDKVIDHCPSVCMGCGGALSVEQATGVAEAAGVRPSAAGGPGHGTSGAQLWVSGVREREACRVSGGGDRGGAIRCDRGGARGLSPGVALDS